MWKNISLRKALALARISRVNMLPASCICNYNTKYLQRVFLNFGRMNFLYYLLLFLVAISALIAVLIATGVLHISVHNSSDPDDLPEEIRKLLDDDEEDKKDEAS